MVTRNARRKRRNNVKKQQNGNSNRFAPVATAHPPTVQMDSKLRQSGVDRLAHVESVERFESGDEVVSIRVEPSVFPRLSKLASIFQRIKYLRLRFEVRSQTPTTTAGGYVTAFIRDPSDTGEKGDMLNHLTAQAGSQTLNWWQSANVSVPVTPGLFYTSPEGGGEYGLRNFSPGRFMIVCDGKSTGAGSMTITCHWTVELSEASLESEEDETPAKEVVITTDYCFYNKIDTASSYKCALMHDNRKYVTCKDFGVAPNTYWKMDHPITFYAPGGNSETSSVFQTYFLCAWDQPDTGSICPAVLTKDGLIDANSDFGTQVWTSGLAPMIAGETKVLHFGQTIWMVDRFGRKIDPDRLSRKAWAKRIAEGSLLLQEPAFVRQNPLYKDSAAIDLATNKIKAAVPTEKVGEREKRSIDYPGYFSSG